MTFNPIGPKPLSLLLLRQREGGGRRWDGGRGVGGWRGDERDNLCTGAMMTGDVAKQPTKKYILKKNPKNEESN